MPRTTSIEPDLLTLDAVAARSSVCRRTIESRVASGELFSVRVGGRRLVPIEAYDAWRSQLIEQAAS
jgi:excisionase family DNA binding protein